MKVITYSLFNNNENSNEFYKKITYFSENIVMILKEKFYNVVANYRTYLDENNKEKLRSEEEYLLEILMIGVFWNCYINKAINIGKIPTNVLIKLGNLREKERIKKLVDINRGILETIFLNKESKSNIQASRENYNKLLNYLKATGEYKQEVKRFEMWQDYFNKTNGKEINKILTSIIDFAEKFEVISKKELGEYTNNTNLFLKDVGQKYKFREDLIFCSRKEVEYHLNMVGAQIMNKSYEDEFLKTKEKRLLLPACMRAKDEYNCKSIKTDEGYICKNCTKSCNVNKYDKLGKQYNFQVYIIPHESNIKIKNNFEYGDIGIVGVACVLNLINGGLKARNLNLVPRCVFLDYCGCKAHWDNKGIITDINQDYLLNIIKVKQI